MVRPASRMLSAISFGVFWRSAPSTSAIMRSRNVSPGFDVIFTTISSDSTRVPPVTAAAVAARLADHGRRLAGDRRLVDRRDALDDVAVAGDELAGPNHAEVADLQLARRRLDERCRRGCRTYAIVSERVLRSVSACALPRPSAIASAKLANNTVNHSHAATRPGEPVRRRAGAADVAEEQERREDAADLHDEHHRVLGLQARVELHEAVEDRAPHDRRLEHRTGRASSGADRSRARGSSVFRPEGTSDTGTSPTP